MEDYQQKLYAEFPKLFDRENGDTVFKYRGFEIASGWYELVRELAQQIEMQAAREGRADFKQPKCEQCKEKFGLLRFYITDGSPQIQEFINEAQRKSATICIKCGLPGTLHRDTWHRVHCEECEVLYQAKLKE